MHSKEAPSSLTLMPELENGGSVASMEEINGSGRSEFLIEETVAEED
jgi:hypothetical protein